MCNTGISFALAAFMSLSMSISAQQPAPVISTRLVDTHPLEMRDLKEYPVYISADPGEDTAAVIESILVKDGDDTLTVREGDGFHYVLWRPGSYGNHQLEMTAVSSNGATTTITRSVEVVDDADDQTVTTMDREIIVFGGDNNRWYSGTFDLPQHVGAYEQVYVSLDIECPAIAGGCDDWDRLAWIEIRMPDGEWAELIRYITPYGVACSHYFNVTPLISLLQGSVELRMFIDTWGTGGWQVSLDLEYRDGFPTHPYSRVDKIWDGAFDFGNPANLQPVPSVSYQLPANARTASLILTNTGHGWGANNTQNAAEFFSAFHHILINGNQAFTQHLWTDCDPNPDGCTGQLGTWQYNRAGWCPGAIAKPDSYDLSGRIGQPAFDLTYRFHESYVDECHPNNPNCVTGVTCDDCNDTYNPVYHVDAIVVSFSDVPLLSNDYTPPPPLLTNAGTLSEGQFSLTAFPNPASGKLRLSMGKDFHDSIMVKIYDVNGALQHTAAFGNSQALQAQIFDLGGLPAGNYLVKAITAEGHGVLRLVLE